MKRALLLGLAAFCTCLFAALGVWQVERRVWKLALIEAVDQRSHAAPAPAPFPSQWRGITAAKDAYRRITVRGQLLHDRETLVQALTEHGPGFWVLTPLRSVSGFTVLVNRGFVPAERRSRWTRAEGQPCGLVPITGLLRLSEPVGRLLQANQPAQERWYSRDVQAIARARGLGVVAPYFIDADAAPNARGWPIGGLTVVSFPNNHLVYALTWFGLALLSLGGLIVTWRGERSR